MKSKLLATAAFASLAVGVCAVGAAAMIPPNIAEAVANPNRPPADTGRDAARKPGEVLAFAGVKRGESVLELIPGGGYFTRILSGAVGPTGHVTELVPLRGGADMKASTNGVAADPHFANVSEGAFSPDAIAK